MYFERRFCEKLSLKMVPDDANSHLVGITLIPLFVFQCCMVYAQINGFFAFSLELNRIFVLLKKLGFYK